MSNQENKGVQPIYTVPPAVTDKTWGEVQLKALDVQLKTLENQKYQIDKLGEFADKGLNALKSYFGLKNMIMSALSYVLIAGIVIGAYLLTQSGKLSGETFAFLMGSVVGYIISILSERS
ncbi:MAG: hypothetical protein ABSB40_06515 [Nitrososphaeria archaeon]|jgi:hypothetical protein